MKNNIIVFEGIKFKAGIDGVYSNPTEGLLEDYKNKLKAEVIQKPHSKKQVIVYNGMKFKAGVDGIYSNDSLGLLEDYKQAIEGPKECQAEPSIVDTDLIEQDIKEQVAPVKKKKPVSQSTKDKISKAMKQKNKQKRMEAEGIVEQDRVEEVVSVPIEIEVMDIAIDDEEAI